jgi:hypothetical protein
MSQDSLDLSPSTNPWAGEQILSVAAPLFDAVKAAPLKVRENFPSILRNNNFSFAVHVTKRYAFLEVTGKFRAQRTRLVDRLNAYRQIFTDSSSGEPAIFTVTDARLVRVARLTAEAPHAFALGSDFSMCAWDMRSTTTAGGKPVSHQIDIIYVVGFGKNIREADCWQEFDSIIRITLSDWSGMR